MGAVWFLNHIPKSIRLTNLVPLLPFLYFFKTHIIRKIDSSIITDSYSENLHIDSLILDVLQIIDSIPFSERVFKKLFNKKIISLKNQLKAENMKEIGKILWNRIPKKWEWVALEGVFFLAISLWTLSRLSMYPKDNLVEQFLETIIEEKTGQQIDLSPEGA